MVDSVVNATRGKRELQSQPPEVLLSQALERQQAPAPECPQTARRSRQAPACVEASGGQAAAPGRIAVDPTAAPPSLPSCDSAFAGPGSPSADTPMTAGIPGRADDRAALMRRRARHRRRLSRSPAAHAPIQARASRKPWHTRRPHPSPEGGGEVCRSCLCARAISVRLVCLDLVCSVSSVNVCRTVWLDQVLESGVPAGDEPFARARAEGRGHTEDHVHGDALAG